MAAAHPFGAFIGCRFKRIRCVHRIKVYAATILLTPSGKDKYVVQKTKFYVSNIDTK